MNRYNTSKTRLLMEFLSSSLRNGWTTAMALGASLRRRNWVCGIFLVTATLVAYGPAWQAAFIWGDDAAVTRNALLSAPDALRRIWLSLDAPSQYFPLTYTTFYIERAVWQLNPAGYHMVNLLLHAANALLVWRVLIRLDVPGAWLAGAIFALHPVQVESAAWISERQNVLMGFFFLLSLLAWTRFMDESCRHKWRAYGLALFWFALALLAKPTACTLPAALLLVLWLKKIPIDWRRLAQIAPFLLMALGLEVVTLTWERLHPGTQDKSLALGIGERFLLACRTLWFYAGKLLWPVNLTFNYPRWNISAANAGSYIWVAATAVLALVVWRAGRKAGAAVVFFVLTLLPVLGLVMMHNFEFSFVADHHQYLACIGPMALAAAGIHIGLGHVAWGKPLLQPALCAALLITLGTLTWRQCGMYADSETLWRTTAQRNPGSWLAQINLGTVLLDAGDTDDAIAHFQKALAIDPNHAKAHENLGLALSAKGQFDQAIMEYQKALTIEPNLARAHEALGTAWLKTGKPDEAIVQLQKAVEIDPRLAGAQAVLGIAYAKKGQPAEAILHFQSALKINPADTETLSNLGMALAQNGQVKQAITQFQSILETRPDQMDACNNLAWLLATASDPSLRDGAKALALAQHASDLGGRNNPVILHTLASAYAETRNFAEAISTAERALDLAVEQKNEVLAGKLRKEIKLYEAGAPARGGITSRNLDRP